MAFFDFSKLGPALMGVGSSIGELQSGIFKNKQQKINTLQDLLNYQQRDEQFQAGLDERAKEHAASIEEHRLSSEDITKRAEDKANATANTKAIAAHKKALAGLKSDMGRTWNKIIDEKRLMAEGKGDKAGIISAQNAMEGAYKNLKTYYDNVPEDYRSELSEFDPKNQLQMHPELETATSGLINPVELEKRLLAQGMPADSVKAQVEAVKNNRLNNGGAAPVPAPAAKQPAAPVPVQSLEEAKALDDGTRFFYAPNPSKILIRIKK